MDIIDGNTSEKFIMLPYSMSGENPVNGMGIVGGM